MNTEDKKQEVKECNQTPCCGEGCNTKNVESKQECEKEPCCGDSKNCDK